MTDDPIDPIDPYDGAPPPPSTEELKHGANRAFGVIAAGVVVVFVIVAINLVAAAYSRSSAADSASARKAAETAAVVAREVKKLQTAANAQYEGTICRSTFNAAVVDARTHMEDALAVVALAQGAGLKGVLIRDEELQQNAILLFDEASKIVNQRRATYVAANAANKELLAAAGAQDQRPFLAMCKAGPAAPS